MTTNYYDIIIIGSGMAGLYSAYNIKNISPNTSFLILEKHKKQWIGGRTSNEMFYGTQVVTGAGIGRKDKDKLLIKLMDEIGIKYTQYESNIKRPPPARRPPPPPGPPARLVGRPRRGPTPPGCRGAGPRSAGDRSGRPAVRPPCSCHVRRAGRAAPGGCGHRRAGPRSPPRGPATARSPPDASRLAARPAPGVAAGVRRRRPHARSPAGRAATRRAAARRSPAGRPRWETRRSGRPPRCPRRWSGPA